MTRALVSHAEEMAQEACRLRAFSGLQLTHLKTSVAELLEHVGNDGFFTEFTKHDITHVDGMLKLVDWLIPQSTQDRLTPADWLMIVLSIYLHDIGMLVTRQEYQDRGLSSFPQFRDKHLTTNDSEGMDYTGRISVLGPDGLEQFLYQEFVRAHHAERVRRWIERPNSLEFGAARSTADEINALIYPLNAAFKADLGIVCESHHSDRLDDLNKFPISKPYGNSSEEVANVQYAAIILRTVDLLQVTEDRTPSITYRLLNPADPISQQEWARHRAVHAVVPQLGFDADGNVDRQAERSVVEVHARFEQEEGFFGLTHYLSYAEQQLRQSFEWAEESRKRYGSLFEFPWRLIDQSKIETVGFLPEQFRFEIDQAKILTLLTGHTLYNNSDVVLRELAQNSIDAVRLQYWDEKSQQISPGGVVRISWDSAGRRLEVLDNGTGMSQRTILRNFLNVGSSRYEEPEFRDRFPTFPAISRFGIGVLSAFMVADSVEVVTVSPEDEDGRRISLRSVHGRYLVSLLDKSSDPEALEIGEHGTKITVSLRPSSTVGNILELARAWFVLPRCELHVTIDGKDPVRIGHEKLRDVLRSELANTPAVSGSTSKRPTKVVTAEREGFELAYALQWSPYFRVWEFLSADSSRSNGGVCVEGVRVENGSPGYASPAIYSIANCTGESAPRTNVARSNLEDKNGHKALSEFVYEELFAHVQAEVRELHEQRFQSISKALQEGKYLVNYLLRGQLREPEAFGERFDKLQIGLIEHHGERVVTSIEQLRPYNELVRIEDELFLTAESVLRQVPSAGSFGRLGQVIPELLESIPESPLLIESSNAFFSARMKREWEIARVDVDIEKLRITYTSYKAGPRPRWIAITDLEPDFLQRFQIQRMRSDQFGRPLATVSAPIPVHSVSFSGLDEVDVLVANDFVFLVPGGRWESLFPVEESSHDAVFAHEPTKYSILYVMLDLYLGTVLSHQNRFLYEPGSISPAQAARDIEASIVPSLSPFFDQAGINHESVTSKLRELDLRVLNTASWQRREEGL